MSRILLAGEQVTGLAFEIKGFDFFGVSSFKKDGDALIRALRDRGHEVTWLETCRVPEEFPETIESLHEYDVIVLSDVGSNSLLFHPEVLAKSLPHPNRLKLLREYVRDGGGLAMIGGWMSFAGIDGKARYHGTPVEEALPVLCSPYDDRQEKPEGVTLTIAEPTHPILQRLPTQWPFFLGYNRLRSKPDATTILKLDDDPLLSVGSFGRGRTAAFTSDCAPHWGSKAFLDWEGYAPFWNNLVRWLAMEIE